MITVTQAAQEEVAKYFDGKEKSPVRLFITSGCGGCSSCGTGGGCGGS
jgi:Fe-S cluster assembly iron-binding protein IscA